MVNGHETHLAFSLPRTAVRGRVLIPKFYDPDLDEAADLAKRDYDLVPLGELLYPGDEGSRLGSWIRREWYGTGSVPYVRTSDLSNWRIRPDYKKGVADEVYHGLRETQDVRAGDILFVAHGTYLVGNVALVTPEAERMILQDHVFRLRVSPISGIDSRYLVAALSTDFVRRQVRARQFSADIIDKIGERHLTIRVPIPKKLATITRVSEAVGGILAAQTAFRHEVENSMGVQVRMLRERSDSRLGFQVNRADIKRRILVPKYYDPEMEGLLRAVQDDADEKWQSLGELADAGLISMQTGVEVGKMAYGTGSVPFVRTSDIADLEVKREPRHGISTALHARHARKAAVEPGDIVLVRDGTYLVGSSAIVTEEDVPALICGGIYRVRVTDGAALSAFSLLVALNLPVVRRQMRSKQFTRDVIDTLGNRIYEVFVPPLTTKRWREIGERMENLIRQKMGVKRGIEDVINSIEPPAPAVLEGRPSWSMR